MAWPFPLLSSIRRVAFATALIVATVQRSRLDSARRRNRRRTLPTSTFSRAGNVGTHA
jgi:hypothetical protein